MYYAAHCQFGAQVETSGRDPKSIPAEAINKLHHARGASPHRWGITMTRARRVLASLASHLDPDASSRPMVAYRVRQAYAGQQVPEW
ncbi:hypothetical protein O9K51_03746 [Purpureocillium lavendulum]|uniref:Uncharacterized protein n=1 Tax=Purpureocillium lavendulum TaxID=1247861 RepID=A0AB34FW27_9HYPO|nr:hypothetical protein O9K51_03746 [Purpureocillium lavendulum]